MKRRDTRFDVWVVEAKMSDGVWYPMPDWGAGEKRRDALRSLVQYAEDNRITWALSNGKHSRCIRCRRYIQA